MEKLRQQETGRAAANDCHLRPNTHVVRPPGPNSIGLTSIPTIMKD
jgi:hypothetical protein